MTGESPLRMGNDGQGSAPSGLFACRNGEILIQAGKDPDFVKLCQVLGLDHLATDHRFEERARRVENYPALQPVLIEAIAKRERQEFYDALVGVGVICGPVTDVKEALVDPQVLANKVEIPAGHPDNAELLLIGSPIRFDAAVDPIRRHPPRLGEHGREILKELLGMEDKAIAGLAACGAIELDRA
jgi:crotonobetainyl-CoA:carnitine CoA-transferase CaiB-like acyl-CoA transferase